MPRHLLAFALLIGLIATRLQQPAQAMCALIPPPDPLGKEFDITQAVFRGRATTERVVVETRSPYRLKFLGGKPSQRLDNADPSTR